MPADTGGAWTLSGRRAMARGDGAGGLGAFWTHPVRVLTDLDIAGARPDAVTCAPVSRTRRVRVEPGDWDAAAGGAGPVLVEEELVVSRDGPVAFVEWRAEAPARLTLDWHLALDAGMDPDDGPDAPPLTWRTADRGCVAERGGHRAIFAFAEPPAALGIDGADGGRARVRVSVDVAPGRPARLAIGGVPAGEDRGRVERMMGRPAVAVRSGEGAVRRVLGEALALESPDPGLDAAVRDAVLRLAGRRVDLPVLGRALLDDPADGDGLRTAAAVAGAGASLAVGLPDAARDVLVFLGRHQDAGGSVPGGWAPGRGLLPGSAEDDLHYLDLFTRYLAWTGDRRTAGSEWPRVVRAYRRAMEDGGAGRDRVLAALAVAAGELGHEGDAATLRAAAGMGTGPARGAGPGAGGTAADRGADDRDGASAGSLEPIGASRDPVATIRALVHGVLGAEPDATRGRLVLRPRFPAAWPRARVRNLPVGVAAVELAYERDGGLHRFALGQHRGGAPLQVVLEPEVAGDRVARARVDGVDAELEPVMVEGRWRVPVQVVLDHERRVELEVEGPVA